MNMMQLKSPTPADDADEAEADFERKSIAKTRKCLMCGSSFPSAWAGERICRKCKSSSTWRQG